MKTKIDYRLYLVTDLSARYTHHTLLDNVAAAIEGGVTVVQFRSTLPHKRELYQIGLGLRDLLKARGVPLIVNDHVDLALALEAEGVHLGQNDLPVAVARRLLGQNRLIGISVTNEDELAAVDVSLVDYIGIGPAFPTKSKLNAAPALGVARLGRMVAQSSVPTVAIGGISLDRAAGIYATGVSGLAAVSAFSEAIDPTLVARNFLATRS